MQLEMHMVVYPNVQGGHMHSESYILETRSPPIGFCQSLSQLSGGSTVSEFEQGNPRSFFAWQICDKYTVNATTVKKRVR